MRFSLSYRDVEELLAERKLLVDHVGSPGSAWSIGWKKRNRNPRPPAGRRAIATVVGKQAMAMLSQRVGGQKPLKILFYWREVEVENEVA